MALEQVLMDANSVTTIIANINSLYNNLVSYTVGLILFVGAFVPGVISFFQRKQFKREQEEFSKQIDEMITKKSNETENRLIERIRNEYQEELKNFQALSTNLRTELQKEIAVARAGSFHIQANQAKGLPEGVLESCSIALPLYIQGCDERNARSILSIVIGTIKKLDKEMLDTNPKVEKHINTITKTLDEYNENGRYSLDRDEIERWLLIAKKPKIVETA